MIKLLKKTICIIICLTIILGEGTALEIYASYKSIRNDIDSYIAEKRAARSDNLSYVGEGTAENPFHVGTEELLSGIRYNPSAHYILVANIVIKNRNFIPIPNFSGSFNGAFFTISGLHIDLPAQDDVGLFANCLPGFSITQVVIDNADVTGRSRVGILAGNTTDGSITLCSIRNSKAAGTGSSVGTISGHASRTCIWGNESLASATGQTDVGGLIGLYSNSTNVNYGVTNNRVVADITAANGHASGVIGRASGFIANNYYVGILSGSSVSGVFRTVGESYGYGNLFYSPDRAGSRTEDEMKIRATYSGWDFNFWNIKENETYAFLRHFEFLDKEPEPDTDIELNLTPLDLSIRIDFTKLNNPHLHGYIIYRVDDGQNTVIKNLGTNEAPEYIDKNLIGDTEYSYFIEAYIGTQIVGRSQVKSAVAINRDTIPPKANPGFDFNCIVNETARFSGELSTDNVGIVLYMWDFGDGSPVVNTSRTEHIYREPGIYTATLTVRDLAGNTDRASIRVTVYPDGQAGSLIVTVIDKVTRIPVPYATLYIECPQNPRLIAADRNGQAIIVNEPGNYDISAYSYILSCENICLLCRQVLIEALSTWLVVGICFRTSVYVINCKNILQIIVAYLLQIC